MEESKTYKAYEVRELDDKTYKGNIVEKKLRELPFRGVLIRVYYTSLNYKDALSSIGNKGVTKQYPFTPGVDAAGVVAKSEDPNFKEGDRVFVTGFDLGMNTPGGLGEFVSTPSDWVFKLPDNISFRDVMMYGTAGLTAGLSIKRIIDEGVNPSDDKDVVVSGASGGVGSISVCLLSKIGFNVTAVTNKPDFKDILLKVGAKNVIPRSEVDDKKNKPLLSSKWDAAIDTVGGNILSTILKSIKRYGCVSACGNAASYELNTTVFPFILRGITLCGIDSAECPREIRQKVWDRLFNEWNALDTLNLINKEITLEEVDTYLKAMLSGKNKGHIIVKHRQ